MIQYIGSGKVRVEIGSISGEFLESDLEELCNDFISKSVDEHIFNKGYIKGFDDGFDDGYEESKLG